MFLEISDCVDTTAKVDNELWLEEFNVIKKVDQQEMFPKVTEVCYLKTSDDENNIDIDGKHFKNDPAHFIKMVHLTPEIKNIVLTFIFANHYQMICQIK